MAVCQENARAHVVEHLQQETVTGLDPAFQRAAWRRREHGFEVAAAGDETVEADCGQRSGEDRLTADGPIVLWTDVQVTTMDRGPNLLGQIEPDAVAALRLDKDLRPREVDRPPEHGALAARTMVDTKPGANRLLLHLEDCLRCFDWRAAAPRSHGAAIAGLRRL